MYYLTIRTGADGKAFIGGLYCGRGGEHLHAGREPGTAGRSCAQRNASTNTHTTDNGLFHAGETGSRSCQRYQGDDLHRQAATASVPSRLRHGWRLSDRARCTKRGTLLGHAGPYNGTVNEATQQFSPYDTRLWSIMSYIEPQTSSAAYFNQYPVQGTLWHNDDPTGLMPLDILAAQALYGTPASTPLSGGQVFGFHSNVSGPAGIFFDFNLNAEPILTLWKGGTHAGPERLACSEMSTQSRHLSVEWDGETSPSRSAPRSIRVGAAARQRHRQQ